MVIGRLGCLMSMGIFTDDENDFINACLRFICLMDDGTGAVVCRGGDRLRCRTCVEGRKSIKDNGTGF